jgi:hypothetical protein
MAIDNDPLMETTEAAKYIHVDPRTMEGWRFRGTARASCAIRTAWFGIASPTSTPF